MKYFLNKNELLELMMAQKLLNDSDTAYYNENALYRFYLEYIEKKGIVFDKSNLKKNYTKQYQYEIDGWYNFKELSEELAEELSEKIELYSDSFWTLFDYYQNMCEGDYKTGAASEIIEPQLITEKIKYLKQFEKNSLSENLTDYLNNVKTLNKRFTILWYNINKDNDKLLEHKTLPAFIDRLTYLSDLDSTMLIAAKIVSLFSKECGYEKLLEIYNQKKGSSIQDELVNLVKKFDYNFEHCDIPLYEEGKDIVYKNTINIDPAALVQKYKVSKSIANNFFKVLTYIINASPGHKIEIEPQKAQYSYEYKIYKPYVQATISSFSSEYLEIETKWFKDMLTMCAETLFQNPVQLNNKNIKETLDHNNMAVILKDIQIYTNYKKLQDKIETEVPIKQNISNNPIKKMKM